MAPLDSSGTGCSFAYATTDSALTLGVADAASTIRFSVEVTNASGLTVATSAPTAVVSP
jgi:hypothetical protein